MGSFCSTLLLSVFFFWGGIQALVFPNFPVCNFPFKHRCVSVSIKSVVTQIKFY
uniref:Uncharacterized protein n=1 Tax=Anguilla anguilla TaxID=7936 RepID=A0A0E9RTT1_ANGAN